MVNSKTLEIIQYKKDHPRDSTTYMAHMFNTTRQNIHDIITRARKLDKSIPPFRRSHMFYYSICQYCGKEVASRGYLRKSHRSCFALNRGRIQLECPVCNTKFSIFKSQYRYRIEHRQKNFYDKKKCANKELWNTIRGKK